jgi:hypothetical protein
LDTITHMNFTVDAHKLTSWMSGLQKAPSQLTVAELNAAATELKVPLPDLMQFVSMFAAGPAPGGGNQLAGGMSPGAVVPTPQADLYGEGDHVAQTKKGAELVDKAAHSGELKNIEKAFFYEPELDASIGVRSSLKGAAFDEARPQIEKDVAEFLKRNGLNKAVGRVYVNSQDGGFPV